MFANNVRYRIMISKAKNIFEQLKTVIFILSIKCINIILLLHILQN